MYFHRGVNTQRGRGFGSLFSGLFRSIFPLAKSVGKRVLQSQFVKNLSSQAIDAGKDMVKNIASDVLSGKKFKESAENELNIAKKNKLADIKQIDGFGETSGKKIIYNISKLFHGVELYRLAYASYIFRRGFGEKKLKLIIDETLLYELISNSFKFFITSQ